MPSPRKRAAIAAAAGVALALLVSEGLVRVLTLAPGKGIASANSADFARIPGIYAPSRRWEDIGFHGLQAGATINSLGYRGREPPADATASLRVLFVGDSFAFGDFVNDEDAWPAQLQAVLDCPLPVVVYNAGVSGSTIREAIAMAERGRALAPHAIVAEFTAANDVGDLLGASYWAALEAKRRAGWWRDLGSRLLSRSALWNLGRRARATWARRSVNAASPEAFRQAQATYAELLRGFAARQRQERKPLLFAAYPSYEMLRGGDRALTDWALGAARAAGLAPIDLWPVLAREGRPPEDLFLVPRDSHPSAAGYALAARAVARALQAQVAPFRDCRVR